MNQVLFGDVFDNIKQLLVPIDLYRLSRSCKKYKQIITEKDIKNSAIYEMKKRLNNIFGDNYVNFMLLLRELDATIIGSFITQCMLGETWVDTDVNICIVQSMNQRYTFDSDEDEPNNKEEHDISIVKFIARGGYSMESYGTYSDIFYKFISVVRCEVNMICIKFILIPYNAHPQININKFMHANYDHNASKNMYQINSNELYIHRIYEIFTKCTNIILDKETFTKMHNRGFRFYESDTNKKVMSNDDIFNSICKVIKISGRKSQIECEKIIDRKHKFATKDGVFYYMHHHTIYQKRKAYSIFNIDITSPYYADITKVRYDGAHISKCMPETICIAKLLYPELYHYHHNYIGDEEYSSDEDNDIILVPSYE